MRFAFLLLLSLVGLVNAVAGQHFYTLSGTVKDAASGEALTGASVLIKGLNKGVVTNTLGYYQLELEEGAYQVQYSFLGFGDTTISIVINKPVTRHVELRPAAIQALEVVIEGQKEEENITRSVDQTTLSQKEIRQLPHLLGQIDPMKVLQLLPGVQSNGEGNNGIFVRGGGIDQNLILFDQAPIYNTGHMFGFFSLFNHAVLKEVNLIKGGIPASYGGRLSSVLEINSREGNFQHYKGEGNVGLVSGSLSLEGPILKNKASFIVSARRTYIDLLSKAFTNYPTIFNTGINYYFDDLNARVDVRLSARDKLAISGFAGSDDFLFLGKNNLSNKIRWKNYTASMRWDHFYSDQSYHTTTIFASRYNMDFSAGINDYLFNINSSIEDAGTKTEWVLETSARHQLSFGAEYMYHGIVPNNMKAKGQDVEFSFVEQEKLHSQEQALFIHDKLQLTDKLSLSAGLRLSAYQQLGPFTRFVTDEAMTITDTLQYGKGNPIQAYWNLDPRASLVYRINEQSSFKMSFDRMHQYLHMAPVSSVSLPTDVWVPSSSRIRPQQGKQYAMGYFRNFNNNSLESAASVYYKDMNRQIEYRDGIMVGYSKGFNYDDSFIFGKGQSYGLEVFLKKNKGRLTGWLSYTLSRTTRTFKEINGGKAFAAKYDRLHNLSLVGSYALNERWELSGLFTYASGNALTLPVGRYIINGNIINEYAGRNTFRMPAYHRLDFSATYHVAKHARYESSWVFAVYNLYNRKNPYYIYFETSGNINEYHLKVSLEKVSLFPIIPSVAYQFKF